MTPVIPRPPGSLQRETVQWHVPYYFVLDTIADLSIVLQKPSKLFLELPVRNRVDATLSLLQKDSPDFGLSLTTDSAYHRDISGLLTHCLHNRFGLSDTCSMHIKTCLHEAIANAVTHGNLALETHRTSQQDFTDYYAAIKERLAAEAGSGRNIYIKAWNCGSSLKLCVTDEGCGFKDDLLTLAGHPALGAKSGRGLFLIQSLAEQVWIGECRQTLCMSFRIC